MIKEISILFSLLFTLHCGFGQTNVYHPFPDSNAIWRVECEGNPPQRLSDYHCIDAEYYLLGDTIFGMVNYKQLWIRFHYMWDSCTPNYEVVTSYNGAIRQDTIEKRIFYKYQDHNEELLYHFDLSVGDTLPETRINEPNTYFVSSIDSVFVGDNYRKRFWISTKIIPNYTAFVEGIGSSFGLVNHLNNSSGWKCQFLCFTQNGISLYPNTNPYCGFSPLSTHEIKNQKKLSIAPNPFTRKTTIEFNTFLTNATLTIYTLFGQEIKRIENISGNQVLLSRDNLQYGTYVLQISDRMKIIARAKLIVAEY